MILDGQNCFSAIATGDSPTDVADNECNNMIDQGVNGLSGFRGEGGAYVAPWVIVRVSTPFTTTGGYITAVLQDSADGTTDWTDILNGPTLAGAQVAGYPLLAARIPPTARRYLQVVYRISTAVLAAGSVTAFLTLDKDVIDQALRHTTFVQFSQSGQISEAVANGVLGS